MKRILASLLVAALLVLWVSFSEVSAQDVNLIDDISKDETVYAVLNSDGTINTVSTVNHIDTPVSGLYTDYGRYDSIINLTNNVQPQKDGGRLIWELTASDRDFYYEGIQNSAELPFNFSFTYLIDGKEVKAEELIGCTGKISITLDICSNKSANQYFIDNYMAQVQLPLSLDKCSNIVAEGAQSVITGSTCTLAYMVLPGSARKFTVSFDARDFEMDGIAATVTAVDIENLTGIDTNEIKAGTSEFEEGTKELLNGTQKLKTGISGIAEGIRKTAFGLKQLIAGSADLVKGIELYTGGIASLSASTEQVSEGLNGLAQNGVQLSEGYGQLSGGVVQLMEALLLSQPEEQKAIYSMQIEILRQQLTEYGGNLDSYTGGVSLISDSLSSLSGGLSEISGQSRDLAAGAAGISDGLKNAGHGLDELYSGTQTVPGEIQKLYDGQRKLVAGINKAFDMFGDFLGSDKSGKPVSFAHTGKYVNSVQFVVRTPELKIPEKTLPPAVAKEPESFWDKIFGLFVKQE